jgi:hypothetical protein
MWKPLAIIALLHLAQKYLGRPEEEYAQATRGLSGKFAEKYKRRRKGRIVKKEKFSDEKEQDERMGKSLDTRAVERNGGIPNQNGDGSERSFPATPQVSRKDGKNDELPPGTQHTAPTEEGEVSGPLADAERAQTLLTAAKHKGAVVLAEITRSAIKRLLSQGLPRDGAMLLMGATKLYNQAELKRLADVIAQARATANLLGRSKTLLQYHKAIVQADKFSENEETDFSRFAEGDNGHIEPLKPEKAVAYFQNLVPKLGVQPNRFGPAMQRDAFTLAKATDESVLKQVQKVLGKVLETGEGAEGRMEPGRRVGAVGKIDQILDAAGVSNVKPYYAEMVLRTNTMDAYQTGTIQALQDPDVKEMFPAWRFAGIMDGRQRKAHEAQFGKLFSNKVAFSDARDAVKGSFDGYGCRCTPVPVSKMALRRLGNPVILEHPDVEAARAFVGVE